MRISILSSAFLFASVVIGVPLMERRSQDSVGLESRDDSFIDLYDRGEFAFDGTLDARDDELMGDLYLRDEFDFGEMLAAREEEFDELERRVIAAKKQANKVARKQRKTEAKAKVQAAGAAAAAGGGSAAAAKASKKAELKATSARNHKVKVAAGKDYKATNGLPPKGQTFNVPAGGTKPAITKTGKDVRKAMYATHVEQQNKQIGMGPGGRDKPAAFGKKFDNNPHQVPKPGTTQPIDGMVGKGREHTFSTSTDTAQRANDHRNQPLRIVTQPNGKKTDFKGVISHDQSRPAGAPGYNDHFKVPGV